MNFFFEKRQQWLMERIEPFNRSDMCTYFNVSTATVSKDIGFFLKKNSEVFKYCKKTKKYYRQIRPITKPIDLDELKALVRTHIPDFDKATIIMQLIGQKK